MKKLITLLFIFINLNLSTSVKAEEYVTLGVDCDSLILFEYFQEMDPLESDFIKRVTSGDCRGTHYDFVPRWYAEIFVSADPVNAFFIEGEDPDYGGGTLDPDPDYGGGTLDPGPHYDGGTLDTIVIAAEPGNNPFSIPWNWVVKFLGFADTEDYSIDDLPMCDPNNLSNENNPYTEIA